MKCLRCGGKEIPDNEALQHLQQEHGINVFGEMKKKARIKGLAWTGMVFTIGILLGILLRGFL